MARLGLAADGFEELINDGGGKIQWKPLIEKDLPYSTLNYYNMFIKPAVDAGKLPNIQIAVQRLEGTILLKLNDPKVPYFHHDPITSSHQWGDEGFHKALDNNVSLIYLASLADPKLTKMTDGLKKWFDQADNSDNN